jgi:hypothetical protein
VLPGGEVERRFSPKQLDRQHFVHQSFSASCIVYEAETRLAHSVNATRIRSPLVDRSAIDNSGINQWVAATVRHKV